MKPRPRTLAISALLCQLAAGRPLSTAAQVTASMAAFLCCHHRPQRSCIRAAPGPRRRHTALPAASDSISDSSTSATGERVPDRPPTLPAQDFRPKQSLGQNFLSDQNYVLKIVQSLVDTSPGGRLVVELGPGPGALTRVLYRRYPKMLAVEIDGRAVAMLKAAMPDLNVVQSDVLQVDWSGLAELRGGRLSVIGNLPYHITSQILFCLLDNNEAIHQAVVTMQLEVAQRIIASPGCKDYGILSVLFQLYTRPRISFKLPPTVFYPQPKVTSALMNLDFIHDTPLFDVNAADLKQVLKLSFQQRRKMLRQSLKPLLTSKGLTLPEEWACRRPEQLSPQEFVNLTRLIFGAADKDAVRGRVWRRERHGDYDHEGVEE